jgi:hypothetical protein
VTTGSFGCLFLRHFLYVSKYLFDWGLFDRYKYKCEVSRLASIPAKRLIPVPAGIFFACEEYGRARAKQVTVGASRPMGKPATA